MIKKLRRRIFWITELLPLSVLFLVLVSYNYSYISYTLSDEIDTLDYCTESVSKYPETMDKYIKMPINDLVEISESNEISNNRVRNVLYTIIADEVNIIKIDENNNLVESARDLGDIDISLYNKDKGKVDKNLYKYAEENGYRYLVILDTSNWLTSITVSLGLSFIALLFAALLFFVVAWYLSKKVTAPVEEAITKQNRFVADASHELKTPVAVINANIAVLEHEFGENKWMNYIKEEGHSMNMLVNQLLSLSRLDHEKEKSGRKKGKIEASFNVYDSIMEAALPFDSIAFEKEAIITTYCDREFTGRGYLSDFKQMIAILVDNAIDHVNRGGEITIKARKVKGNIEVSVMNSGSAIPKENLPYIFDRFYKVKRDEPDHDSGEKSNFGLGLSIAKAIAEKNCFDLRAESEADTTAFIISIPQFKS